MDKIKELIRTKPRIFVSMTLVYLCIVIGIKWLLHPTWDALWFFLGGAIGVYFLDAAELFFALQPSPFRSIVFGALLAAVSLFVVTSSSGTIGSGLVLSLYLQLLFWQIGELRMSGHLNSWYRMVAEPVNIPTQRGILIASVAVFVVETYIFIR